MSDLWHTVAELGAEIHPERIAVIASKVSTLPSVAQLPELRSALGPYEEHELLDRFMDQWKRHSSVAPAEMAAALRAASAASLLCERHGSTKLVWTGPSTGFVPVRHTEQVLCELIDSVNRRLFLVSFVAYEVQSVRRALLKASERGVKINVLLESSTAHGGKVSHDSVREMRESLPTAEVYVWTEEAKNASEFAGGAVHAKCAVADSRTAFVTSANLTEAAMERNMECGVLVSGGRLPEALHQHLEALVTTGVVERV